MWVLQWERQRNLLPYFLPCCPTKSGFRKIHFPAFYFNYMSNEPDTKQQSDCDSSPGVTAAVIRARLLGTPLPDTLACSLCFWVTCSFTFFSQPPGSRFSLSVSLTSNSSVVWQVVHSSSPLLSSQAFGWAVELLDTPDSKELSASMWAGTLALCLCNSIIFQMHLQCTIPRIPSPWSA